VLLKGPFSFFFLFLSLGPQGTLGSFAKKKTHFLPSLFLFQRFPPTSRIRGKHFFFLSPCPGRLRGRCLFGRRSGPTFLFLPLRLLPPPFTVFSRKTFLVLLDIRRKTRYVERRTPFFFRATIFFFLIRNLGVFFRFLLVEKVQNFYFHLWRPPFTGKPVVFPPFLSSLGTFHSYPPRKGPRSHFVLFFTLLRFSLPPLPALALFFFLVFLYRRKDC